MKKVFRWIGIVLGGILGLILIAAIILFVSASFRLNKVYTIRAESLTFPSDPASIAHGGHLAGIYCTGCHGNTYGGKSVFSSPALGAIFALNLTPGQGGAGREFTDANWVLAVRHGINPEGKPLVVMPSKDISNFSDADFEAIIAYLKSVPAVDEEWPDPVMTPLGKILLATGAFGDALNVETIDHNKLHPAAPPAGASAAYGEYLVKAFGCTTCHGKDYSGGRSPNPAAPPAPDLTRGGTVGKWTDLDFINTMRSGVTPSQHKLTDFMPWKDLNHMTDDELKAVWLYLQSLPSKK